MGEIADTWKKRQGRLESGGTGHRDNRDGQRGKR